MRMNVGWGECVVSVTTTLLSVKGIVTREIKKMKDGDVRREALSFHATTSSGKALSSYI